MRDARSAEIGWCNESSIALGMAVACDRTCFRSWYVVAGDPLWQASGILQAGHGSHYVLGFQAEPDFDTTDILE